MEELRRTHKDNANVSMQLLKKVEGVQAVPRVLLVSPLHPGILHACVPAIGVIVLAGWISFVG